MDDCYDTLPNKEKDTFELFLDEPDLDILNWVMGRAEVINSDYQVFITAMQEFNSRK
jgi:succinate dehydrogenase flavin-adding protein (antitoxin of CptAB toxin-antitoxin module)